MFDELNKYQNHDHFFFQKGQSLAEVSANVPDKMGVFYIFRLANGGISMVCIGKPGNMTKVGDSGSSEKSLREEFSSRKLEKFFESKINKEKIDGLDIYWFVTVDGKHKDLPKNVEKILKTRHVNDFGELPSWNMSPY